MGFNKRIWCYKNFNMAYELNISGEFIYNGIIELNQIDCIEESAELFSFLYQVSVGIERLQKIILVLWNDINEENYEEFKAYLITHSHQDLHKRIQCKNTINFNNRENAFLEVLTSFYIHSRYNYFNISSDDYKDDKLLEKYLKKYCENLQYHFITQRIVVDNAVKAHLGRVIGSITKKYYQLVREGSNRNGTFSYELKPFSKAEKVFLNTYRKNSLQEMKVTESVAVKELIACVRNTKDSCAFLRFLDNIEPLDIDVNLINDYLESLSLGDIPQALVDEVEALYTEKEYSIERVEYIDLIGNRNVDFGYGEWIECKRLIDDYTNGIINEKEFTMEFIRKSKYIDDEEFQECFQSLICICQDFIDGAINSKTFHESFASVKDKLYKYYNMEG